MAIIKIKLRGRDRVRSWLCCVFSDRCQHLVWDHSQLFFSLSCSFTSGLCVRVIYWWPFLGIPAIPLVPGKWSVPQRDIFRSCEAAVSVSACTHNPAVCWLKNVVRLKMQSASASVGLSSRLHRCNRREVCVITAAMGTVLNLLSHKVCDWSHQQSSSVFVCASFTQHWVMLVLSFLLHRRAESSAQIAAAARSPRRGVVDPGISARSDLFSYHSSCWN